MKRLLLVLSLLTGCAHTDSVASLEHAAAPEHATAPEHTASQERTASAPPACSNIQDGDWHIEFTGRTLVLGKSEPFKSLVIDRNARVECRHLSLVQGARQAAVLIEFETEARGTSIGVSDHLLGVASIDNAKWIVEPVLLSRTFEAEDKTETREIATVQWSKDDDGKARLTLTDSKSGATEVFEP